MIKSLYRIIIFVVLSSIVLIVTGRLNPRLFQFASELFTINVGIMIFVLVSNSRDVLVRYVLIGLGIAYLYIGTIDAIYLISSEGYEVIANSNIHLSKLLWVTARLLEAVNILVLFILGTRLGKNIYFQSQLANLIYIIVALLIIFNLPIATQEGFIYDGIVIFAVQILVITVLAVSLLFLKKQTLTEDSKYLLGLVLLLKIMSNILFIPDVDFGSIITITALLFKFFSYVGLYYIIVNETIKKPIESVYSSFKVRENELVEQAKKDSLTGIYNHSASHKKIEALMKKYRNVEGSFFVTLIDIDDFKIVNDTYGHQAGDQVLVSLASIIELSPVDDLVAGRYGGDEFILAGRTNPMFPVEDLYELITLRLEESCKEMKVDVSISAGTTIYTKEKDVKELVYKSDIKMYESKRLGKNRMTLWE